MKNKLLSILLTICMVALLLPVKLFTLEARAESGEQAVYDLISEVPTVDGGQATNCGAEYDYDKLVDGNTSTKYYLSNADPWVEFHYSQAFVPKQYVLWTAFDTNNNSNRNPASWTIKAKLNKTDAWTTIATAENSGSNQLPTGNTQSKEFSIVENENAYKYFRFEATRQSNHVQLGELQFKEATPKVELTWNMSDQSSMQYTISGNSADFVSNGNTMRYTWTGTPGWNLWGSAGNYLFHKAIENQLQVTFPYLTGKVTKVEINNINFSPSGMSLSVSNGTANLKNGNSDYFASTDDTSGSSVTFTGEIDVNTSNYLRFTFVKTASGNVSNQRFDFMNNGSIKVTLVKEQKADLGHTFTTSSITANGKVLTAICTSDDADHNTLYGGAGHQYTLTLNAADGMASYMNPVNASITPSVGDFNEDTGLGATCIVEYAPQGTSNWSTSAPATPGNYTARATVRINSTDYVLTANFSVIEGHYITNNNPQQLSVNKTGALEGESITVTFTPKMGESVATLTVTGDTTSLSISSGITDNGDNTYTFAMPNEDVTIGATFNFPANSNFTQDGNTYIIKNADGWDYFCQRMRYDANLDGFIGKTVELAANITVTTMAGNGRYPFKGTFDGKGKTLTFNPTEVGMYTAPFQNTDGATICNLHVTGLIEGGTNSYLGGLVGSAEGNLTIRDCHVSTQISTTFDSNTLSSNVGIGGIVGYVHYTNYDEYCRITGTVYDGLIYNPNYSGSTYGCGGFVGCLSEYGHVDLTDCLFIEGQYDNNGGKHELLWGHDNNKNSTFFHRTNNQGYGTLKNCFFVATHFLKQGSPAVESTDAPDNFAHFGDPTDHRFMQTYGHTMVFNGKYYTPIYGDLVEYYDYSGVKGYNIEYDDAPLGIPDITSPLWTDVLRYNRSFTKDKPVIVMLPFNFTKDNITLANSSQHPSGHFYSFAGVTRWAPVMESANEVTSMTANTPYLYVPGEDTEYLVFYLYDGFYIFTAGNNGGDKTAVSGDWTLTGTYTEKTWTEAEQDFGRTFILNNSGELTDVTDTTIVKPTDGYFVISVNTYTVTFDANGGTGTIAAETVTGGATYTLPDCTFTAPEGKIFKEWSVKIGDAEAVNKQPGDTITVTADTTVTAVWEVALTDGYYLIGQNGWTADDIDPAQKFAVNPENNSEYLLTTTLQPNDQFKVVRVANGAITGWYPDAADNYGQNNEYNNHVITTAGTYTICFRPDGLGGDDWYARTLYVFRCWKSPSFEKQSLVLNELIGVRFKLQLPKTYNERVSYADSYMEFAITGRGADTLETTHIDYDDTDPSETATFLCRVNALQMAETITATFHFKLDGEDRTIEKTYSVKEYIEAWDAAVQNGTTGIDDETQRNKTNALVHALADYGHYVQPFLAWANNFTIGTDYAEMTKFYTDAYGVAAIKEAAGAYGKTVEGSTAFKSPSMSLVLDSETAIRVFLAHADSTKLNLADVQITVSPEAGVDWNAATQMTKTQAGNRIMVEIKGVKAAWLCKNFTVTVTENTENGEQSQTVTLSALSYVAPFLTAYDGNAAAENAICALYQYAMAAK